MEDRSLLGKRISRLDGPVKATGQAKYSYDKHLDGLLIAKLVSCPHAHARIKKFDVASAEKMPGVRAIVLMAKEGDEIQWVGTEVAAIASDTEELARDAVVRFLAKAVRMYVARDDNSMATKIMTRSPDAPTSIAPKMAKASKT
jgi:CO/xanthine dehydrogenase Mo-binding subunit